MSFRKFCRILEKNGFLLARVKGGHYIYKRETEMVLVPHSKLKLYIIQHAIKKYELSV